MITSIKHYLSRTQLIVLYNHFSCHIWQKHINDLIGTVDNRLLEGGEDKIKIPNNLINKAKKKGSEGQIKMLKEFGIKFDYL